MFSIIFIKEMVKIIKMYTYLGPTIYLFVINNANNVMRSNDFGEHVEEHAQYYDVILILIW